MIPIAAFIVGLCVAWLTGAGPGPVTEDQPINPRNWHGAPTGTDQLARSHPVAPAKNTTPGEQER